MNIVVLASGRGSNFDALLRAIDKDECAARVVGLVSDQPSARARELAAQHAIPDVVVPLERGADRVAWNERLCAAIASFAPDLVVLAGFMRLLGGPVIERYAGRIINVHPALLPSFPGTHAPEQAIAACVRISGCTVHLVDAGIDTGPILAQGAVAVHPDDTAETLHERIQTVEHTLLPRVVDWIARGVIELGPRPRFTGNVESARDPLLSPAAEATTR